MNIRRLIFLSIFGVYQLSVLIFTLVVEYKEGYIFTLLDKVTLFKYGALIGVVLIAIELVWVNRESKGK